MRAPMLVFLLSLGLASGCGDDTDESSSSSATGGDGGSSASSGGQGGSGGVPTCTTTSLSTADCPSMCAAVVAASCAGGPSQAECESNCTMLNDNPDFCPAWGALVDCAGDSPTYVCMDDAQVPEGCEIEFYCFAQCF